MVLASGNSFTIEERNRLDLFRLKSCSLKPIGRCPSGSTEKETSLEQIVVILLPDGSHAGL
jgi:hypothetical protein